MKLVLSVSVHSNTEDSRMKKMKIVPQDKGLLQAQNKARGILARNNYCIPENVKCCLSCFHHYEPTEAPIECLLLNNPNWTVNNVEPLAVCDKWKSSKKEEERSPDDE